MKYRGKTLAGMSFQRSYCVTCTTRDRSTVCFETMWSTDDRRLALRDVWTSYEFVRNFRVFSSSWYEPNNSHASRRPKQQRSSLQLYSTVNEQWVKTFVCFCSLLWPFTLVQFAGLINCQEFRFRTCLVVELIKVKLGCCHRNPLITSRGMQMVCVEEFLLRDRPD